MFRRLAKCALCAAGLLALCGAVSLIALLYAGSWLRLDERPRPADAIVVLAGSYERSLYAADFYQQHYAPKIYVSVPARDAGSRKLESLGIVLPYEVEVHRQILAKKGIPARDILTFGHGSLSTVEEAEELMKMSVRPGPRLLVVTSPYHARRAKLIFDRAFRDAGVDITVVATSYEEYHEDWWRSQDSARNTVLELAKIAYYYLGGRFRSPVEHP